MGLSTLFIGHSVSRLEKVDSTNRYLRDLLAKKDLDEGFVVWAMEQYAGRGQRGTAWLSQPNTNLTLSIALRPTFLAVENQFWLTKVLALAAAEFVSNSLGGAANTAPVMAGVKIKWPNDIYITAPTLSQGVIIERKIAGILLENILEGTLIKYSIAGIGINVNQEIFDPALPNPVSLKLLTGNEFDLTVCMENLCICVEKFYLLLHNSNFREIDEQYHKLLYRRDVPAKFSLNGTEINATIQGVSREGYLLLTSPQLNNENDKNNIVAVKDIKQLVFL
jgi:BirA family biotin operon repressor/biotin-[acetyl-CoA-carboxylase] ligase